MGIIVEITDIFQLIQTIAHPAPPDRVLFAALSEPFSGLGHPVTPPRVVNGSGLLRRTFSFVFWGCRPQRAAGKTDRTENGVAGSP